MNKIYKVIWSKVRNCYVAVSEIAKRNGKSCTSVNCGAKANRGHAGVVLAIALSLSMTGGGVAGAEDVNINIKNPDSITTSVTSANTYFLNYVSPTGDVGTGTTFTVGSNGIVYSIQSSQSGNTININSGGQVLSDKHYSAPLGNAIDGGINNNRIVITGTVAGTVRGGAGSDNTNVTNNKVTISGTVNYPVNYNEYTVNHVIGGKVQAGVATNNIVEINGGTVYCQGGVYGGFTRAEGNIGAENAGNCVTITSGNVYTHSSFGVYGGYSEKGNATGNKVDISGGTITGDVYGGNSVNTGDATANIVTIKNTTLNGTKFYGGSSYYNATTNKITISGGSINNNSPIIYAGSGFKGGTECNNNTVTLAGVSFVYGSGDPSKIIIAGGDNTVSTKFYNNTVNLYGAVKGLKNAELYGYHINGVFTGNTTHSGNQLHIGGVKDDTMLAADTTASPWTGTSGNKVASVNNFDSIVLHNVNWSPDTDNTTGTPVLAAGSFSNIGKLDISGMQFTGTNAEIGAYRGNMKLLASNTNNDFSSLSLTYKKISNSTLDGAALNGTATLNSTHPSQIVKVNNSTNPGEEKSSDSNNVRFWYRPNLHRVSLDSANNYKNVIYSIADEVRHIAFLGAIGWSTEPARVADSKYDFSEVEDVYVKPLSFTFTPEQAGALSSGSSMTLLSNAKGLAAGKTITYDPNDTTKNSISQSVNYSIANVASLTGTLTGTVATEAEAGVGKVTYTATGMTLDSINLAGWDGSTTSAVPAGWTKNSNGIRVTTVGLTVPTTAGTSWDILKTNGTANYFQNVQFDSGSTNNNVYKLHSFSNESSSGSDVTFTGTQYKGVKVGSTSTTISNDKLVYAVDKKNVTGITLGGMSWGTGRTPGSDDYIFSTVTGVDASGLTFTFTDTQAGELQIGSNMTLLSGATGLPAGVEPSYGGEKTSHSQSVPYSAANSVTLTGTLTGTVATKAEAGVDKVTYTALGMTLNSINLAGWNSSTEAPFVPAGWTNQLGNNSITADGFTGPTLAAGESRVILQATTEGYFNDDQITGGKKNATTGLTEDTAKGVTFAGNHLSGGVKADANGTKLAYYAEAKDVSGIKLGNVAWNDGRPAETLYVFNNVTTVDATDLLITFANESDKGSLSNTSTTTLVSNATGLPDSVAVNYKNSASNHTQEISYNITNGVSMTGTLTGTIASGTVSEKKALVYSVSGMTLDSINLAGWDSSIAATAVPAGWTNQLGNNSITAEGFDEPALALGQSLDILTATTEGYFNDDQITGGKKYSTSSLADDTVNGVTLSGTHYGGVKAEDNGKKLTYYAETMDVTGIALGNMTWGTTTGRTASGLYIFNNVSSVNASGLSFTNPDEVSGSMELLSGATDLAANKMVTGADHSQSFDKAMTNGVSLSSTLTGTVSTTAAVVKYTATGTTVNSVNLAGWDGTAASSVPDGWALAAGATIETDGMTIPTVEAGKHIDILQSNTDNFFANVPINGDNAYGKTQYTFMESDTAKSVTIAGTQDKGVTLNTEKKHLIYKAGTLDVASVTLGPVEWKKGATVFDRSGAGYNYAGVAALGTDGFAVSYASPETVVAGDSMTLLQANATLKDMAEQLKQTSYSFAPVSGVTIDATVTGSLEAKGGNVTYTATANQASKLTFTNVDWKDSGALLTRPSNITFAGADVDTTKINFQNVKELDANKKMTLVSDFGDSVGTITGRSGRGRRGIFGRQRPGFHNKDRRQRFSGPGADPQHADGDGSGYGCAGGRQRICEPDDGRTCESPECELGRNCYRGIPGWQQVQIQDRKSCGF